MAEFITINELKAKIRTVPHFPKEGVMFKDVTTLLKDSRSFRYVIEQMKNYYKGKKIDIVVSAESRGFILGSVMAHELHAGFVPLRKPGKLPAKTLSEDFYTEYSKDAFEIHEDAILPGQNVLIVDDLLATGGTMEAAAKLVERLGGKIIGLAFLIELEFLHGRRKLEGYDIFSLISYGDE
jgi:adenine phosphoribosyltransferase